MKNKRYIAYYRVSTNRQGQSGLGLEAQKEAVTRYLNGGDWEIIDEYTEIESGKKSNNRPQLHAALAACKKYHATLIIAKLDRLARNVFFISGLMESGIEFVAVDNPNANRLMLHMLAAFAEHEREQISQRTKDALAAARERGVQLGKNGKNLAVQNKEAAMRFIQAISPQINAIRAEGYHTSTSITNELNKRQIPTFTGGSTRWHQSQVYRLLKRMDVCTTQSCKHLQAK